MRKIILILVLGFSLFIWNSVFAVESNIDWVSYWDNWSDTKSATDTTEQITNEEATKAQEDYNKQRDAEESTSWWNWIEVKVTEKIPWADCEWSTWDYTCTVKPGFWTVMQLMGWIIKYFTFLASLGWVLFIVINWIMLSMWGMWWSKDEIKKRITMTIGWLILLLLSGLILHSIAPWIYQ